MVAWTFNKTPQFIRSAEELGLSIEVLEGLEQWAVSVPRIQTNRTKRFFCSPHNAFEIWTARIPDPNSNRGRSGGFRLVYFFTLKEQAIYLDRMEHRSEIGGKDERPREQAEFTGYLNALKNELFKEFETENCSAQK